MLSEEQISQVNIPNLLIAHLNGTVEEQCSMASEFRKLGLTEEHSIIVSELLSLSSFMQVISTKFILGIDIEEEQKRAIQQMMLDTCITYVLEMDKDTQTGESCEADTL